MLGINQQLLMWMFGAAFAAAGAAARLGRWKKWYWTSRGAVYGYVPLGLLFFVYAFNADAEELLGPHVWLYHAVVVLLIAVGVWWSLRPPAFVKPAWVLWVEEYPQAVQEAMADAAKEDEAWESHVASQEAVSAWAQTLRKKQRRSKATS